MFDRSWHTLKKWLCCLNPGCCSPPVYVGLGLVNGRFNHCTSALVRSSVWFSVFTWKQETGVAGRARSTGPVTLLLLGWVVVIEEGN